MIPDYLANPLNRCYFCKQEPFSELVPLARREGLSVIVYGENASDLGDYRPGAQAAAEHDVRAPLKEVGLTKSEIRQLSAQLGLPTADKPQMACLSSRVPYGEDVNPDKLQMIEQAEYMLRGLGFHDVRVSHHELKGQSNGQQRYLARIELGEMQKLFDHQTLAHVAKVLRQIAGHVPGALGGAQATPDDKSQDQDHQDAADQPEFFRNGGENEVGMAHLQKPQLRLGAMAIPLAKQAARTDRDQGLLHIVGCAEGSVWVR